LWRTGIPHEQLESFYSEHAESIDRRSVVSAPPRRGRAAIASDGKAIGELFPTMTFAPLAVRGERLALARALLTSAEGFELTFLSVWELDASGLWSRTVTFDVTDLVGAVAELEERHRRLAGDAYTNIDRHLADFAAVYSRGDRAAVETFLAPGLMSTDHRHIGYGTLDRDGMLAWFESRSQTALSMTVLNTKIHVTERVSLVAGLVLGATQEGSSYEWCTAMVTVHDEQGRACTVDLFDAEQWADAVAVFHEQVARTDR